MPTAANSHPNAHSPHVAGPEWAEMVLVGIVARAHGNKGEVIVNAETDFPEQRFCAGARVFTLSTPEKVDVLQIESVRFQQGRPIVAFRGFDSINAAEQLAGAELRVPETDQEALPTGSFYHHQLIGCEVMTENAERVGRVSEVQGGGEATRLVVQGARGEVLIPLVQSFCDIDVAAKRIIVHLPEGLLDVNGDWR